MFQTATRNKYRYPYKGNITTEDLWDLSLQQLDSVYSTLMAEKAKTPAASLLNHENGSTELETKISIVSYIFNVKKSEAKARTAEKENAARKQRIMQIIEQKKYDALANMSEAELTALLKTM